MMAFKAKKNPKQKTLMSRIIKLIKSKIHNEDISVIDFYMANYI